MNYRLVLSYIGVMLKVEAASMVPAAIISLCCDSGRDTLSLAVSILIALALSFVPMLSKPRTKTMRAREGFLIVSLSWLILSAVGALPFVISGEIPNFIDAYFEVVSGFTTTGSTVVGNVEGMARGLLYWRCFTNWLGGMGVLMFVLALASKTEGVGGPIFVLRAESPGPVPDKMTPKIKDTAKMLYIIYTAMTVLCIILFLAGGMKLYDSVLLSFSVAGTGGFGTMNDSMGSYTPYLQTVAGVFMALFGVNFSVYYALIKGKLKSVWKDEELRTYIIIVLAATLLIAFNISGMFGSFGEALHHSFFQVSSITTTTGHATVDFDLWPAFSKCILLLLMIVGASAGSTGGGVKVIRIIVLFRMAKNSIVSKLHPTAVKTIRVNGEPMKQSYGVDILQYLSFYSIICAASILILCLDTDDLVTSLSGVFACLNNIGPGLAAVGPTCNFAGLSYLSKIVLTADMLLGRLELYPILLLFAPSFWKKAR